MCCSIRARWPPTPRSRSTGSIRPPTGRSSPTACPRVAPRTACCTSCGPPPASEIGETIADTRAASVAWQPDGSGFWYTRYPAGDEYHRHVRFHRIGADPADDDVVLDDFPTAESWPDVTASDDGRHLLVDTMVGWCTDRRHVARRRRPGSGETSSRASRPGRCSSSSVTTWSAPPRVDAPNGRIVAAPLDDPSAWRTIVAERDVVLGGLVSPGGDVLVVASIERRRHDRGVVGGGDRRPSGCRPGTRRGAVARRRRRDRRGVRHAGDVRRPAGGVPAGRRRSAPVVPAATAERRRARPGRRAPRLPVARRHDDRHVRHASRRRDAVAGDAADPRRATAASPSARARRG